jgi:predicted membrane metal-binding protein
VAATKQRVTKKKLTLAQHAAQFLKAKRLERQAKALRDESDPALKAYFKRTGKTAYKGIGYSKSTNQILDQRKVKEFLGPRLERFMKPSTREQLSVLGDEAGE